MVDKNYRHTTPYNADFYWDKNDFLVDLAHNSAPFHKQIFVRKKDIPAYLRSALKKIHDLKNLPGHILDAKTEYKMKKSLMLVLIGIAINRGTYDRCIANRKEYPQHAGGDPDIDEDRWDYLIRLGEEQCVEAKKNSSS